MGTSQTGMGAMPIASGGTGFRVWAPFAQKVFVAGEFNGWSDTDNPLVSEGNG
ncbi:MAG: early set domain-containing protein, partial [Nostoc sp.]